MIALADCNNFYASCERVFNPALKYRPVVVLSNNDGCVIARSEEAKNLGIEMGVPAFSIEKLLEESGAAVFSSNFTLYGSMSDRVMKTFREICPRLEVYSIDEAFLDLSAFKYQDLGALALRIRQSVYQNTGIPVTIGIAPSKTLAKMANQFAKRNLKGSGVYCLDTPEKTADLLAFTGIGEIWGIGKQYQKLLLRNGFRTAADLLGISDDWLRKHMSVGGLRMLHELRGIPCIEFVEINPAKKNICVARGFGKTLQDKKDIQEALSTYTAMAAAKLRQQHSCAGMLQVFIQTNIHRRGDQQLFKSADIRLPVGTNHTPELIKYALKALDIVYQPGLNYKKVGITLTGLVPENQVGQDVFDKVNRGKDRLLMGALDEINQSYGKDMVRFGSMGYARNWKLRQERLSFCYTTRIDQVLTIKI